MIYKLKAHKNQLLNKLKLIMIISLFIQFSCQNQDTKTDGFIISEQQDVTEIQKGYKNGDFSVKEVVQAYLNRINKLDKNGPKLNSIIQINPDAIKIAEQLDKEMSEGKIRGPLEGIPVLLKDNIDTHDKMPTTCGARALRNSFPLKDSYIVKQLREAGAVILGKTNLSEWANGRGRPSSSGWSGVGGQTKNPYVLTYNPSGSSSGSAVAVSANLTTLAIGTETTGSLISPSQTNGIVGIKPTVGLWSRSGIIPMTYTFDTPGPMARSVRDAAILLGALVDVDSTDEKTLAKNRVAYRDYTQFLKEDGLKGKRLGVFKKPFGIDADVDSMMYQAIDLMKSQGAEIVEVDSIMSNNEMKPYFIQLLLYEYKHGLNKYFESLGSDAVIKNVLELIAFNKSDSIGLKYFNQSFLEMIVAAPDLTLEEYSKLVSKIAEASRKDGIDRVMDLYDLDAIIAPSGDPAWKTDLVNGDPEGGISSNIPADISGYPNITVPMGFVGELPVGISFFGRAWSEPILLKIAYAYERATKHRRSPKFLTDIKLEGKK